MREFKYTLNPLEYALFEGTEKGIWYITFLFLSRDKIMIIEIQFYFTILLSGTIKNNEMTAATPTWIILPGIDPNGATKFPNKMTSAM